MFNLTKEQKLKHLAEADQRVIIHHEASPGPTWAEEATTLKQHKKTDLFFQLIYCFDKIYIYIMLFYPTVNSDHSRCSRHESCDRWSEPQHFNTHLDQCVDISVTPSNMSVTSPATQVYNTHNW